MNFFGIDWANVHLKYWMTLFYPAWVLPAEKLCNNLFLITCYILITKISFSKLFLLAFEKKKKKNRYQNCVHGKIFKSVLYCFDLIRIKVYIMPMPVLLIPHPKVLIYLCKHDCRFYLILMLNGIYLIFCKLALSNVYRVVTHQPVWEMYGLMLD